MSSTQKQSSSTKDSSDKAELSVIKGKSDITTYTRDEYLK